MFKNLKSTITQLAKNAVITAENELGTGKGQEKKKLAINYIIKNLPCREFVKSIIAIFLSGFIDNVIEAAVVYMKSLPEKQGE